MNSSSTDEEYSTTYDMYNDVGECHWLDEIFSECNEDCYVNEVICDSTYDMHNGNEYDICKDFYKLYKTNDLICDILCECKEESHFSSVSEDSNNECFFSDEINIMSDVGCSGE